MRRSLSRSDASSTLTPHHPARPVQAFMLTAGFYVSNIPVWISWVKFIGFIYYGYNLLIYYQYQVGLLAAVLLGCRVVLRDEACM